jgi:hypothetical protein
MPTEKLVKKKVLLNYYLYASLKIRALKRSPYIETIVLGSSHGDYLFDPSFLENSLNLCTTSQDLSESDFLINYAIEKRTDIKRVIVFYSVFSSGYSSFESKDITTWLALKLVQTQEYELNLGTSYLKEFNTELEKFPSDFYSKNGFYPNWNKKKRPKDLSHYIENHVRYSSSKKMFKFLEKSIMKHPNIKFTVVIPPVRSDYYGKLPSKVKLDMLSDLSSLKKNKSHVNIIDLMKIDKEKDHIFLDFDHVDPISDGPEIFTSVIRNELA